MRKEWEGIIQKIIDECGDEKEPTDRMLMAWRAKLGKEPSPLQPHQIDEIIREVRRRLSNPGR